MTRTIPSVALVRRATAADVGGIGGVGAVMAEAFADYPWTRWIVSDDNHGARIAALQRLVAAEVVLPYGELWVAEVDGALAAAALWLRPDSAVPQYVWRDVEAQSIELAGDRGAQFAGAEALAATLRPADPHWYLGGVGVRPAHQGAGLGAAVLAPVLERADTADEPMYLETSTPANVGFYRRRGFAVTGELTIPDGGPPVWGMSR